MSHKMDLDSMKNGSNLLSINEIFGISPVFDVFGNQADVHTSGILHKNT